MMIRRATLDDADHIAHVHVEGWRSAYKTLLPSEFLADLSEETRKKQWLEILTTTATNEFAFVAELEGNVVGFINGGPERTNDPCFVGEFYAIYVLEDYRRREIGTALFRNGIEFLRNCGLNSVKIWVLRDNPYRPFYDWHGGQIIDEKIITIGSAELIETAYGWKTLESLR